MSAARGQTSAPWPCSHPPPRRPRHERLDAHTEWFSDLTAAEVAGRLKRAGGSSAPIFFRSPEAERRHYETIHRLGEGLRAPPSTVPGGAQRLEGGTPWA